MLEKSVASRFIWKITETMAWLPVFLPHQPLEFGITGHGLGHAQWCWQVEMGSCASTVWQPSLCTAVAQLPCLLGALIYYLVIFQKLKQVELGQCLDGKVSKENTRARGNVPWVRVRAIIQCGVKDVAFGLIAKSMYGPLVVCGEGL